jgi:RNA 2',3'-cyclic 3'-phosphodiesterase
MKKRLFFSINLKDEVKKEINFYLEDLKNELKSGVKWVNADNLHITLLFLGLIKKDLIPDIVSRTEKQKRVEFSLKLNNISYFPKNKKDARMIWINVSGEGISDVLKTIEGQIGFRKKEKFIPHITLGRIKRWDFKKLPEYEIPEIDINLDMAIDVSSFELMESNLKKTGPEYSLIKSFKLENNEK